MTYRSPFRSPFRLPAWQTIGIFVAWMVALGGIGTLYMTPIRFLADARLLALLAAAFTTVLMVLLHRQTMASARLRVGEARFRDMAVNVPGIIFQWVQGTGGNSGFVYVSPRTTDILGVTPEDLTADWRRLPLAADDARRWEDSLTAAVAQGRDWSFEGRFLVAGGGLRWGRCVAHPVRATSMETVLDGIIVDITEERLAQTEVVTQEGQLRAILHNVVDAIITIDRLGVIQSTNPAAERLFGWPIADMIGNNIKMLMPEGIARHHDHYLARYYDAREGREVRSIVGTVREVTGMRRDGSEFPLELSVGEVLRDGKLLYTGVCRDISERREAERALQEKEARFRDLIEGSIEGILIVRPDFRPVFANRSLADLNGFDSPEAITALPTILPLVHDDDREKVLGLGRRLLDGAVPPRISRLHLLDRQGGSVWVDLMARAVVWEGDPCLQLTLVNVSDWVRYERELELARRASDAANEAKSRFLATMSHELRTPMTGILGMTDLLLGTSLTARQQTFATTLYRSAETLLALLDDVLDFSKIEAGQLSLECIDYDPGRIIDDVMGLLGPKASKKGLALTRPGALVSRAVKGDPLRIRQILLNLVGNAIKFTEHGSITVTLSREAAGTGSPLLRFTVADTGIGITPDQQAGLFQPFAQADTSTTRRFGGTGLGLAICRHLIGAMGGAIAIDSRPGHGTTVTVTVPAEDGDPNGMTAPAPGQSALPGEGTPLARSGLRLLVAEDNEVNRLLLVTALERFGHEIVAVENGREAVAAVQGSRFDLVLMDMQMPEMDGPEATRAIRALAAPLNAIPIVALTADALAHQRRQYLDAGLTDFLTKPIDWPRLTEAIARLAGGRGAAPPPAGPPSPGTMPVSGSLPILARDVLDALAAQIGGLRMPVILQSLVARLDPLLDAIETAIARADPEATRRAAHALRGTAGQFGLLRTEAICAHLEREAERTGADVADLYTGLPGLNEATRQAKAELETLIAATKAATNKESGEGDLG